MIEFVSCWRGAPRRCAIQQIAVLVLAGMSGAVCGQEAIRTLGFASVTPGGADLVISGQPPVKLAENTWFESVRTSGSWTAGYAYLDGEKKSGWVLTAKLAPESIERQAQTAAEWEERGAKVERDARGAVLSIDAADSDAGDAELAQVISFPRLEELSLGGSKATSAGLVHLTGLPRLKRLFLDGLPLNDEGLKPLQKLSGLESLSLSGVPITDAALEHVSRLTELQVLNLSDCPITDEGMKFLAPLTKMETLALKETKIRGPGLDYLRVMERLNVLNLSHCPLESENLEFLHGLDQLRILHVAGCNLEPKHVEELENNTVSLAVFD